MEKKKRSNTIKALIVIVIVCILLLLFIFAVLNKMESTNEPKDSVEKQLNEEKEEFYQKSDEEKAELMDAADEANTYEFDSDKLKLEGSVEFEGPDFESGSMEFDTYTGLKIRNVSDEFLKEADLEFKSNSGDKMSVHIEGIKPGQMVFAIACDHKGFSPIETFQVVSSNTVYEKLPVYTIEGLNISCTDRIITVENNTGDIINNCEIYYKGKEGEILMGGLLHKLTIDRIENNEIITSKSDSLLGRDIEIIEIKY